MAVKSTGASSALLSHDSSTQVPADFKIRPLRDQIIVEPLNVVLSRTIIVKEDTKPLRGIIKAVGPGHFPMHYDGEKGKRTKVWRSEVFQPTTVKVGDVVELGGVEFKGYAFPSFVWGGIKHIICREQDVSGVDESLTAERARAESEEFTA